MVEKIEKGEDWKSVQEKTNQRIIRQAIMTHQGCSPASLPISGLGHGVRGGGGGVPTDTFHSNLPYHINADLFTESVP